MDEDLEICERAMKIKDFPKHFYQVGYRLGTFSKVLASISHILQRDFGVSDKCQVSNIILKNNI